MKSHKVSTPTADRPATLLRPRDPEGLRWEMQSVQLALTRRAYELFEMRGREHGHDQEDWFQAETELLRPVSVMSFESDDRLSLRANVLGFGENEIQISIEPRRVAILGRKEIPTKQPEGGMAESTDWYPDQILRLIDLPTEVEPDGAVVELHAGLLEFELPKVAKRTKGTGASAA
jgi:HSP20 family molecular chaperone IbpA